MAALSIGIAALGHEIFYLPLLQAILSPGESPLQDTSAEALDSEIRAALPIGSTRSAVETLLPFRQISYNYSSPREIVAFTPALKGSTLSARTVLLLWFRFDDHDLLESIRSRVLRTPVSE